MAGDFEQGGIQTFISGIQSSARRLRTNIDAIIQKYNKPFVNDDEINLFTLSIQKDKGSLRKLKGCYKLGTAQLRSTKRKDDLLRSQIDGSTSVIDPNASMAIQRQYNCYLRRPDNRDAEPSDAETLDSDSSDEDDDKDSDEEEADADGSDDFESGNEEDLEEAEKLEDFTGGKISVISESETELDNERATEQVRKSGNVQSDQCKRVNTGGPGQVNGNERRRRGNENRRENVNMTRRVLLKSVMELTDENVGVAKERQTVQLQIRGDLAKVSERVQSQSGRDLVNESGNTPLKSGRELANKSRRVRSGKDLANESGNAQSQSGRELVNKGRKVRTQSGRDLANKSGNAPPQSGRELVNKGRKVRTQSGRDLANKSGNAQPQSGRELANKCRSVRSQSGSELVAVSGTVQHQKGRDLSTESGSKHHQSGTVQHQKGRDLSTESGSTHHQSGKEFTNESGKVQPETGEELAGEGRSQQLNGRRELPNKSGGVQLKNERELTNESGKDAKGGKAQSNFIEQVKSSDKQVSNSLASENGQGSDCAMVTRSSNNSFNTSCLDNSTSSTLRNLSFVSYQSPKPATNETFIKKHASIPSDNKHFTISQNLQSEQHKTFVIGKASRSPVKPGEVHVSTHFSCLSPNSNKSGYALQKTKSRPACKNLQKDDSANINTTYVKSDSSNSSKCENTISESQLGSNSKKPQHGWWKKMSTSVSWQTDHSVNMNNTYVKSDSSNLSSRCEDSVAESQLGSNSRKPQDSCWKKLSTSVNWQKDHSVNVDDTCKKTGLYSFSGRRKDPVSESPVLLSSDIEGYERSFSELHLSSPTGAGQFENVPPRCTRASSNLKQKRTSSDNNVNTTSDTGQFENVPPRSTRNISASSNLRQECTRSDNNVNTTSGTGQFENVPPRSTRNITASSNLRQERTRSDNNVNKLSALLFHNLQAVNMDVTYDKSEIFTASNRREGPVFESQVYSTSNIEKDERPFSELKLSSASAIGRCKELSQRTTRSPTAGHKNTEHPNCNIKWTTDKKCENDVKQLSASHFRNLQAGCSVNMDVTYEKSEMFSASSRRECPASEAQVSVCSATERDERPGSDFSATSGSERCEDVSQTTRSASRSLQTDCPSAFNRMFTNDLPKSKFCNKSLTDQSKTIGLTSEKVSDVHSPNKSKNDVAQRRLSNTRSKLSEVSPRKRSATSFPVQHSLGSRKSVVDCQNWHVDFSSETVSISETMNNSTHEYNLRSKTSGNVQRESANQFPGDVSLTSSLKNLNIHSSPALVLSPHSNLASQRSSLALQRRNLTSPPSNLTSSQSNLALQRRNLTSPPSKLTSSQSNLASQRRNLTSPPSNLTSSQSNLALQRRNLTSPPSKLLSSQSNLTFPLSNLASPSSKLASPRSQLATQTSKLKSPQSKLKSPRSKLASPRSKLAFPQSKSIPSNLTFSYSNFAFPHSKAEFPSASAPSHFSTTSTTSDLEFPFFSTVAQYSNSSMPSSNLAPTQTHLTTLCSPVSTQHNSNKGLIPHTTLEYSNEHVENLVKCGLYVGSPNRVQKGVQTDLQCENPCSCCHRFLLLHGFNQDRWASPSCEIHPNQSSHNPTCGQLKRKAPSSFTSGYFTDISTPPKRMQTCSGARLGTDLVVNTPPTVKTKCLTEPTYHHQDSACLPELCCLHGNHQTASQKQTSDPTICFPGDRISRQEVSSTSESVKGRRFMIAKKQRCSQDASFANHSSSQDRVEDNWFCLSHRNVREDCCYHPPSRTDSRECDWKKASSSRNNHEVPIEVTDSRVCEWVQASRRTTNPNALRYVSCFPNIQQNQLPHCSSSQLASCKANHVSSPRRGKSSASHVPCCFQPTQTEHENTGFEDRIRNSAECSNHTHPSPRHISANKTCRTSCPCDRVLRSSVEKQVHAVWKEIQAERDSADTQSGHLGGRQKENYVSGSSESCWGESNNEADGRLDESESVGRRLDESVSRRLDESGASETVSSRLNETVGPRLDESVGLNKTKNRSKQTSRLRVPMISTFLSSVNTTAVELPSFVENHSPSPKFKVPKSHLPRLQVGPQKSMFPESEPLRLQVGLQKSMFPESFLEQFSPLNPARRDSDKSAVAAEWKNSPPGLKSSEISNSKHIYKQRSCNITSNFRSQKIPGNRASTPVRTVHGPPEFCLDDTVSTIISSVSVAANERLRDVEDRVSPELTHSDDTDSDSFEEIDLL